MATFHTLLKYGHRDILFRPKWYAVHDDARYSVRDLLQHGVWERLSDDSLLSRPEEPSLVVFTSPPGLW